MARAELTDAARYDLWEIYSYYVAEAEVTIADRIRDDILKKIRLLAEHNLIGSPRFDALPEMRALPHQKFVIFYLPTDYGVQILRVIHSARDIDGMLATDFVN